MAELKLEVSSLEDVPEAHRDLYEERDGRYVIPGITSNARLREFRETNEELKRTNIDLAERLKRVDGVDMEEYERLREQEKKIQEKKLIDAGDVDALLEQRYGPERAKLIEERDTAERSAAEAQTALQSVVVMRGIAEAVAGRAAEGAIEDIQRRAREAGWQADGENLIRRVDGNIVYTSDGTPETITEWVQGLSQQAPHLFRGSSGSGSSQTATQQTGTTPGSYPRLKHEFSLEQKTAFISEKGLEEWRKVPVR